MMRRLAILLCCLWWAPLHADEPTPMDLSYAELEQARDQLRWRLDVLKRRSRGIALPPQDARWVERYLGQGYYLLRHPPLRAAFHSLEEIQAEQADINIANQRLDRIQTLFENTLTHPPH